MRTRSDQESYGHSAFTFSQPKLNFAIMNKTCTLLLSLTFLLCTFNLLAQTPEAPAADAEPERKLPIDISGYADLYYRYAGNETGSVTSFTSAHNAFGLGMANLVMSGTKGKFGFMADIGFGQRAVEANYTDVGITQGLKQLFITYQPTSKIKLTAGNFATFVGYESIDAPVNALYSTAYMFSKGPFFHTGLKADFTLSDKFSAMLGVFNDTDSKFDAISQKHVGAQLTFASGNFKAILNYLGGREGEDSVRGNQVIGHQIDLVATLQATEKTMIGLNVTRKAVLSPEDDLSNMWGGAALYLTQAVNDAFALNLRGEIFTDPDGLIFGLPDNNVGEITLGGSWKVDAFTLIPEIRYDFASEEIFGNGDGGTTAGYPSFVLAAIYKF